MGLMFLGDMSQGLAFTVILHNLRKTIDHIHSLNMNDIRFQ